jgi:sterol desaturase/sphingolipid hydroxylase (fatty acid hydroxylase superfamily)
MTDRIISNLGKSTMVLSTIVLIVLKSLGIISWNWIWVFAPIWFPVATVLTVLIVALIVIATVDTLEYLWKSFRNIEDE